MDLIQDDTSPLPSQESGAPSGNLTSCKGYPLAIIQNGKVDEKFCCGYCKLILRNPVQSSCGHRFCQDCLRAMQFLPSPVQCQSCVGEGITDEDSLIDLQDMFEDKAARREMKKIPVRCVYQSCTWKGTFHDFIEHEDKCERKKVPCHLCGIIVSKAKVGVHETKNCPKRMVTCAFCKENIIFEVKEKHMEECPKYLIKCDNCQMSVERSKIGQHKETECTNRIVTCPYPECDTRLPYDKFLTHISKGENLARHIYFFINKSILNEKKILMLETAIGQLRTMPSYENMDQASASSSSYMADTPQPLEAASGDGSEPDTVVFEDRQKLKLHEDLMSVLHSEILRCITKGEALGRGLEKSDNRLRDCYTRIEEVCRQVADLSNRDEQMQVTGKPTDPLEYGEVISDGEGLFTWVIQGFGQVKRNATHGDRELVCSPAFTSCPGGYTMRLKLYPNGEGENRDRNLSLYFQIVKGPSDDLLLWPFNPKVHFMLVDQKEFKHHMVKAYQFDQMNPAAQRPKEVKNAGAGFPAFISVQEMESKLPVYWPKDIVYLKFHVQMPRANQDRLKSLNPVIHHMTTPAHDS